MSRIPKVHKGFALILATVFIWTGCDTASQKPAHQGRVNQGSASPTPVNPISTSTEAPMKNTNQTRAIAVLSRPSNDYFKLSTEKIQALQQELASPPGADRASMPPPGPAVPNESESFLAIAAPARIPIADRNDLPIWLARQETGLRRWKVSQQLNTRIVAVDLVHGRVISQRLAIVPRKRMAEPPPSGSEAPPDSDNAASVATGVESFFLKDLLNLEWAPSRWALTVLSYDRLSNTIGVALTDGEKKPPKPEALIPTPLAEVLQGDLPAGTSETGVFLSIPPQAAPNQPIPLEAAVQLPLPQVASAESAAPQKGSVLVCSLLFLQLDDPEPLFIQLNVPAQLKGAPGPDQKVSAHFRLDARKLLAGKALAGNYQVFLFAGSAVAGPYPIVFSAS